MKKKMLIKIFILIYGNNTVGQLKKLRKPGLILKLTKIVILEYHWMVSYMYIYIVWSLKRKHPIIVHDSPMMDLVYDDKALSMEHPSVTTRVNLLKDNLSELAKQRTIHQRKPSNHDATALSVQYIITPSTTWTEDHINWILQFCLWINDIIIFK